jgi:hypothetical protein
MVWSVVRALWSCGYVVKAISSDGAATNHLFYSQNASDFSDLIEGTKIPWKCRHPYDLDEDIFFVQDSCHVLKVS